MNTADQVGATIPAAGNAAIASTDVIATTSAHNLVAGNKVRVVTITGGAGLAAATNWGPASAFGQAAYSAFAMKVGARTLIARPN